MCQSVLKSLWYQHHMIMSRAIAFCVSHWHYIHTKFHEPILLDDIRTKVSSVKTHVFVGGTTSPAWDLPKPGCGTNVGGHCAPHHICYHVVSDGEHSALHCVVRGPFPRNPAAYLKYLLRNLYTVSRTVNENRLRGRRWRNWQRKKVQTVHKTCLNRHPNFYMFIEIWIFI